MDELEFAQRLKRYRRERGLTQQELADRIGVSNKSVSRWESGSYPDVPTLLSLARALDVTVDALLDPGAPVPTLQKSDWQNLLSFAFAIGGGLAFYLLRRFVPVPVCWALYLGCLAYGIYLQTHYTYHARWFRLGSWAMCFCVSWTLAEELGGVVFQVLFPTVLSQWKNMIFQLLRGDAGALLQLVLVLGPLWLAGACGLTVLTQLAARRLAGERGDLPVRLPDLRGHPRLARAPFAWSKAMPALCPIVLAGFWYLYRADSPAEILVPAPAGTLSGGLDDGRGAGSAPLPEAEALGDAAPGPGHDAGLPGVPGDAGLSPGLFPVFRQADGGKGRDVHPVLSALRPAQRGAGGGRPSGGRCVPAVLLPAGGVGAGGAEGPAGAGGVLNFS